MNIRLKFLIKLVLILNLSLFSIFTHIYSFPLKVKDDLGREIEIVKKPERLVSLSPSNTEILFALGMDSHIVGVTEYCNYPEEARRKPKVGGFADPDIEKIVSLNPDLVLSFGLVQIPVVKLLEKRGLKTFWVNPHTIRDILFSIEKIGMITGSLYKAKKLKDHMEVRLRNIREGLKDIPEEKRPTIFRVMGLNPLSTVGGDSFQTDLFYVAGGRNIFSDIKRDYFEIEETMIFERNPDIVLICGEDEKVLKKRLKEHVAFKNLPSVKDDRILVISCDLLCRPGPRIVDAVEKVSSYLHPERFSNFPQRIISLGPSITESLCLLGLKDRLVGITNYCERPPEIKKKEKVGGVVDISVEKILSLKPDLVFATSLTDPKTVEKLRKLGINVVSFSSPKNFEEICEQFLELGRITGRYNLATELIKTVRERVSYLRKEFEGLRRPSVFIQVGVKPLFTVAGDSFINDFINFAGGENIARDLHSGFFSREEVLRSNPDIIIIVTMGISGEQEKENWQRYSNLKAVRNNRIFIMDSYKLCSPTPVSFVETLEEVITILHPERKR